MATVDELLDGAAKLDACADDLDRTRENVRDAGAASLIANYNVQLAIKTASSLGDYDRCIGDDIRQMREHARLMRQTAATYTKLEDESQTGLTVA
jgi:hypothetical protein